MSKSVVRPQFTAPPPVAPAGRPPVDANIMRLPELNTGDDPTVLRVPAVVQPRELSPGEAAGLKIIGVDPTVPVPREALERLAQLDPAEIARLTAPAPGYAEAMARATAQPVVPQRAVRMEDLPAEQQAAFRATMAGILAAASPPAPAPAPASPPPAEKKTVRFPVVDDRPKAQAPPPPVSPPPPPPPAEPPPASDAGGAGAAAVICPRCGWDCREADTVRVGDADRTAFLACVLALPAKRFSREYPLFGDRLRVRFRELTPDEQDEATRAVHRRASQDADGNTPGSMPYYMNLAANYRMLLAVAEVENASTRYELAGAWDDARRQGKTLEEYARWVMAQVAPTDSVVVVFRRAFDEFAQLCQKLREAAADPDFYAATA